MAGAHRSAPSAGSSRDPDRAVTPPRPPNAWILYRAFKAVEIRATNERVSQGTISRMVAEMWKDEDEATRQFWERKAEDAKHLHSTMYPNYRYQPRKKEDKKREKEDRKNRRAKKAKPARPKPSSDTNQPALPPPQTPSTPSDANATMSPHVAPSIPQLNRILAQAAQFKLLAARHGSWSSSAHMSAAPSPSPEPQPCPSGSSSRSSSGSVLSPDIESQASTSSSQLSVNQYSDPSLPSPNPWPDTYASQPFPTLPYPLVENTAWNSQLPNYGYQNAEGEPLQMRTHQYQNFAFQSQYTSGSSHMDPFSGMLVTRNGSNAFDVSTIGASNLLAQPFDGSDQLEVTAVPPSSDYTEDVFRFIDFNQPEQQDSLSTLAAEDPETLFQTPEAHADAVAQQHQASLYAHQMMNYMPLPIEATSSSLPVQTTVAPQLLQAQNVQHTVPMPPFAQMTNVSTVSAPPFTPYVPPAGAIYSSIRRVAASWKAPLPTPPQMDDPAESWYTN